MAVIKAYYDRKHDSIDGLFTIQSSENGEAVKLFSKLPARSGLPGYTRTNYYRGRSPIPYGEYYLWLKPVPLQMAPGGDFFPISSKVDDKSLIQSPHNPDWKRRHIGLHRENNYPGSAGCIVLVQDTPLLKDRVDKVFDYLKRLGREQAYIKVQVL